MWWTATMVLALDSKEMRNDQSQNHLETEPMGSAVRKQALLARPLLAQPLLPRASCRRRHCNGRAERLQQNEFQAPKGTCQNVALHSTYVCSCVLQLRPTGDKGQDLQTSPRRSSRPTTNCEQCLEGKVHPWLCKKTRNEIGSSRTHKNKKLDGKPTS
jgi:hypothetical protein